MDVLVTGAEERQGLAVIRALGKSGLKVCAGGLRRNSFGFYSNYTKTSFTYPSPLSDKEGFARSVLSVAQANDIPVVMPVVESTVIAVDEYRSLFEPRIKVAIPSSKSLSYALDKKKTYELADSLGIRIPRTCYPSSSEEAHAFATRCGFPLIMKPRAYSSYRSVGQAFDFKIRYAKDADSLQKELQGFEARGAFPMLQEYCTGIGVPQSVLCAHGDIIGIYQHRRGRDYPLTGGVASVVISEKVDPELRLWTEKLMKALRWNGIAQVEYRVDRKTGQKVLFEINGRIWAPVSAAIQWGLNYPHHLYHYITTGDPTPMPDTYPLERRVRYLRGDLIALEGHLCGDNNGAVEALPGKLRALWNVIKDFRPGVRGDVTDWSDPLPSLHELYSLLYRYSCWTGCFTAKALARMVLRRDRRRAGSCR